MNNSESRLNNVFFYGLYMAPDILTSKQVELREPRIGFAEGYRLRIGNMATLLRDESSRTYGIVYALTHEEIKILYDQAGLDMYASEVLLVTLDSGETIPALCKNLLTPPKESESNSDYEAKLVNCMRQLKVPTTHL